MSSETVAHINDADFQQGVLEAKLPVLVDFWAVWCGPCRAISPHLEALAREYRDRLRIVKLNIDENQRTPMTYQIRSIPTLLLFKEGAVVDQLVGNPGSKAKLAEFVDRHI